MRIMIKTTIIDTPLGEMTAAATKEGVCLLKFSEREKSAMEFEKLVLIFNTEIRQGTNKHLRSLKKQLKEYFKGKRKEFVVPLAYHGTDFQKSVWESLMNIPYGKTVSYLAQAESLNNPRAVRAVAGANGSNPVAILIPCHRVIGSDGDLTGYGGGLERKRWLIDHERKYTGQPVDGTLF